MAELPCNSRVIITAVRPFGPTTGPLLSVDDALQQILAEIVPLDSERVPLEEAHGRVLRESVAAAVDVPPFDNSAMDGYALRSADVAAPPVTLRLIGEVPAGGKAAAAVAPGTALRIMTGAPIPSGADAVAPVEITDGGAEAVTVQRAVAAGANIRRRGGDMRAGAIVLPAGVRIGAGELAVAASARHAHLAVGRRPKVAILTTGDELASVDEAVTEAIVDSNSYALSALVAAAGATPWRLPIVRDTREATIAALESASAADMIVTTGGVSVGAYDFVKEALDALGATTHFWRVAMKPGKPVVFATLRGRPFFGLPGNPVSAMVSFALFVAPAIRRSLGQTTILDPVVVMRTSAPLKGAGERRAYLRVRVVVRDGELVAEPMRLQDSHISTSMTGANGLAIVQAGVAEVGAGERVEVMLIGPVTTNDER